MKTVDYGPYGKIEYYVFDPTGNITALSVTDVDPADQPSVAAVIMNEEPDVEQVGFVRFADPAADDGICGPAGCDVPVMLRMAGGEFCGNATMCAAALYLLIKAEAAGTQTVKVKVSGASAPLEVSLTAAAAGDRVSTGMGPFTHSFEGAVEMPPSLSIDEITFSYENGSAALPLVRMGGIDHIIIEETSALFTLKNKAETAEAFVREWCGLIDSDCLGMMFLDSESEGMRSLTPLVYVPGADTLFWENSCASGSAAAGMYLAERTGKAVDVMFDEPAGRLRVESDPPGGTTILHGSVMVF